MANEPIDRVQQLFEEALALPEKERVPFVARRCGDDWRLRDEVISLLVHHERLSDGFLSPLRDGAGVDPDKSTAVGPRPGGRSGPVRAQALPEIAGYEVLRELHRGGQGVVYEAHDKVAKRKVAVKVLLEGPFASRSARARFEREIELVANLKHPNIVVIFHSGLTADGRQYCVMDYIRGKPLTEYVRERRLPLEDALGIFATVCDAVDYAHQKGVIHRDLKPTNILVDTDGNPNVLDFGLAKMIGGPERTVVSLTGQMVGTLPYMSPEQVRGNPDEIDTRTDVYALGVILYELLTGQFPYPVDGSLADVQRHILTTHPASPCRRWDREKGIQTRRRHNGALGAGPLDEPLEHIILKALEKSRERRYASAADLAGDIRRYLRGEQPAAQAASVNAAPSSLCALLLCDLAQRTELRHALGTEDFAALVAAHDTRARALARELGGEDHGRGEGLRFTFEQPIAALRCALAHHEFVGALGQRFSVGLKARAAVHYGSVRFSAAPADHARDPHGLIVLEAERMLAAALAQQTLLTRTAFELAWQEALGNPELASELVWRRHGVYEYEGSTVPGPDAGEGVIELCEAGRRGFAPCTAPPPGERIWPKRDGTPEPWRPASTVTVPTLPGWTLEAQLGIASFGEVWSAESAATGERCVLWLCVDRTKVESLTREHQRMRRVQRRLAERNDIARVLGVNFSEPPYYVQMAYTEDGALPEWAASRGGWEKIPLSTRIAVLAQASDALGALHAIGELHRDIKPGNILIEEHGAGAVRVRLADLGVGRNLDDVPPEVEDPAERSHSQPTVSQAQRWPSYYHAPELVEGGRPTTQSDIYALGVVTLQVLSGDLKRPPVPGADRSIRHGLLRSRYLRRDTLRCIAAAPQERLAPAPALGRRLRRIRRRLVRDVFAVLMVAVVLAGAGSLGYQRYETLVQKRADKVRNDLAAALSTIQGAEGHPERARPAVRQLEGMIDAYPRLKRVGLYDEYPNALYNIAWGYKIQHDALDVTKREERRLLVDRSQQAIDQYLVECRAQAGAAPALDDVGRQLATAECDFVFYNFAGTLDRAREKWSTALDKFQRAIGASRILEQYHPARAKEEEQEEFARSLSHPVINLGLTRALMGDVAGARLNIEEAIKRLPVKTVKAYDLQPWFNAAEIRAAAGDFPAAMKAADVAERIGDLCQLTSGALVSADVYFRHFLHTHALSSLDRARLCILNAFSRSREGGEPTPRQYYLRARIALAYARYCVSEALRPEAMREVDAYMVEAQAALPKRTESAQERFLAKALWLVIADYAMQRGDVERARACCAEAQRLEFKDDEWTCFEPPCPQQGRLLVSSDDLRFLWIDSVDDLDVLAQAVTDAGNGSSPTTAPGNIVAGKEGNLSGP